jgi:cardiolipin synthase
MARVSHWKFLTSSKTAWTHMLHSFERAQKSIDLVQFVFGHDGPIMEETAKLLKEKVKSGVRVRLLLDAVGSFSFFKAPIRNELEEAGVEIVFHRTLIPPSWKRLIPSILRDHRKLIIIDEEEAHIGGVIIEERARDWRDTNVVLFGPIVADCREVFDTAWRRTYNMKPIGEMISNNGKGEFYLLGNSFRRRDKLLYQTMVRKIAEAKSTVYITNPYFALTHNLRRAFFFARERGVDVRILLPRRSDNLMSDVVGRFFYRELLAEGVRIFHYTKDILHAKTMSVDGTWASVGSCNFDWLSVFLNYELNVVTTNAEFTADLEKIFFDDLESSKEVTFNTKGWYGFFGEPDRPNSVN